MSSTTPRGLAALLLPLCLAAPGLVCHEASGQAPPPACVVGPAPVSATGGTVALFAGPCTLTMPDATAVTMWGFGASAATIGIPGPAIVVPDAVSVLDVTLTNGLAAPVSFVILGQAAPTVGGVVPGPTFVDSAGTTTWTGSRPPGIRDARIRSFTQETAPGASVTYRFSGLRAGTFLYESGTHQAVQVQMGLYGAMTRNAADAVAGPPAIAAQAYTGVSYDTDLTLLYSEVDPALHAAAAGGEFGTPAYPSTIGYVPRYFLVNGAPFVAGPPAPPPVPAGNANGATLLRLLNAGLATHVPTILGASLGLVAEDGNAYAHARRQYSAPLPAGKTADAILTAPAAGSYPLFDRALALMSGTSTDGGLRTVLAVGASVGPVALADAYSTPEDSPLAIAAPGVLANDDPGVTATLVTTTPHGTLSLQADGSFTYAPAANFNGTDSFTYRARAGTAQSAPTTVAISVTPVNDAPTAVADSYSGTAGVQLAVGSAAGASPQGILLNDSDVDGNPLTAALAGSPSGGTLALQPNGSFTFTAASAGTYTFSYTASDGTASSASTLVTITIKAPVNHPPVAVDDTALASRNVAVNINVLANDSDLDEPAGKLPNLASSVVVITAPLPRYGAVTIQANGQIRFVPARNYRGTAVFTYKARDPQNALSNTATVRVNVH